MEGKHIIGLIVWYKQVLILVIYMVIEYLKIYVILVNDYFIKFKHFNKRIELINISFMKEYKRVVVSSMKEFFTYLL